MDAVCLEVSRETAVVTYSLVVPGGGCIAVVYVVFSEFSLSPCFGAMIFHFAVCGFVVLVSISLSASSSVTSSTTATITTMGV